MITLEMRDKIQAGFRYYRLRIILTLSHLSVNLRCRFLHIWFDLEFSRFFFCPKPGWDRSTSTHQTTLSESFSRNVEWSLTSSQDEKMSRFVTLCAPTRLQPLCPSQNPMRPLGHDRKQAASSDRADVGSHGNLRSGQDGQDRTGGCSASQKIQMGQEVTWQEVLLSSLCRAGQATDRTLKHLSAPWVVTLYKFRFSELDHFWKSSPLESRSNDKLFFVTLSLKLWGWLHSV